MIGTTRTGIDEAVRRFAETLAPESSRITVAESLVVWLRRAAHVTRFEEGDVVMEHHAVADSLHFLAEGDLHYRHIVGEPDRGERISYDRMPFMPVGWSSLDFHRYRATAIAQSDGRLLSVPLTEVRQIATEDPRVWVAISDFVLRTAVQLLWEARGRRTPDSAVGSPPDHQVASGESEPTVHGMYRQSPGFARLSADCRRWLVDHTVVYRLAAGNQPLREGVTAEGLWLLHEGRVALTSRIATESGDQGAVRHSVLPGALLSLSSFGAALPAPYGIEPTRKSTLAFVPRSALAELIESEPRWAVEIIGQQLRQLRSYLVSTRVQLGGVPDDGGVQVLRDLVEDGMPALPVGSALFGVPTLLQDKRTREQGFRVLYRSLLAGTEGERAVAEPALDRLSDFERGHRFSQGMLATYAAVVRNRHLPPVELRSLSSRYFLDALSHVPYVMKGLENLPDDPNCIFIYNHMAYADDSILPNGFLFNPDSHFLSSMIMGPKYGDGIRISRTNAVTEFWRSDYYEPQAHIPVTTPESGWRDESPEEKQQRKEQFFEDCAAVLAAGQPFSIAPEGTITEEHSVTERSPAPLKAGAFLMSGRLPSRPRIVPVAFANIDKPAYEAVFSCVIKPGFHIEERGVDVNDRAELAQFLESYRIEFRGHVEEAIDLVRQLESPGFDSTGLVTNLGDVDSVHREFEQDVRALEVRATPLTSDRGSTVFYGSTTFSRWTGAAADVADPRVANLGFAAATLEAGRRYLERLVVPYQPARLVVCLGESDLDRGAPAALVVRGFERFARMVQEALPHTPCWFVSIKPVPGPEDLLAEIRQANARIAAAIEDRAEWRFVDWYRTMVDEEGRPKTGLFTPDQNHVDVSGYALLAGLLRGEFAVTE